MNQGAGAAPRVAVMAVALAVLLHGVVVLAGWWMAWPLFTAPPETFIPMAPSTALTFSLLSLAWLLRVARPDSAALRTAVVGAAGVVAVFMLVNIAMPARLDALLGGGVGMFGQVRLGVMSPVTAGGLLIIALAMVLEERARDVSAWLATAAVAVGATVGLGYLYGTPLLYGSATIPVALPTGLSLLLLGATVVGRVGSTAWPVRAFAGSSPRARMLRAFLPVTVLLVIAIGFLHARLRTDTGADQVLVTAWIAVAGGALMAVVVSRMARRIGGELERAWAERQRAEQRYRAVFEDTPAGIVTTTADGRVLLCNPALAEMFGTTVEDFLSRPITDYYWDADERQKILAGLQESGRLRGLELRMRRVDGTPVWLLANVGWIEVAGEAPVIETAALDITGRKTLEQQLWQAQKLDALGSLAGGVAHDFNNILTAILGAADWLGMNLEEGDPRRADVDEIKKAVGRATGLTRQLLAFSRRQPFESCALQLDECVRDLVPMLRRLIGPRIRLATEDDGGPGAVWADPHQVEQVVVNLVVNARDAMPDGGAITVSTRDIRVEPDDRIAGDLAPGPYVELSVRDSGSGMAPDTVARIFEPFFTTKQPGKGTGLGLATVWGIVKQSRGHIFVESTLGSGTTFRCMFPTTDAPIRAARAPQPARRLEGRETILIVEDEAAILNASAAALRRRGYEVLTAPDGATAIDVAEGYQGSIDLVLSDGVLSDVRVPELLQRLRVARPQTRILIMSGYAEEAVLGGATVERDTAFLAKPFSLDGLAERVRQVLDGEARSRG